MGGGEAIAGFTRAVRLAHFSFTSAVLSATEGEAGQQRGEVHVRVPVVGC